MSSTQTTDEGPSDAGKGTPPRVNDPRMSEIAQELARASALHSRGLALEDAYIRYVILANAGGVVACLGIADALAGKSAIGIAPALSDVVGPIAVFLSGVIFSGLLVSLRAVQALHEAEEHARRANSIREELGHGVVLPRGAFGSFGAKILPHLNLAINAFGLWGQFAFAVGSILGINALWNLHP